MSRIKLLEHNQKPTEEIVELYNNSTHSVLYVAGTGIGKSYVMMGVIDNFSIDTKVLYILPKYVINQNLSRYLEFSQFETQFDFATYNYFSTSTKTDIFNNYDFIIIDECHHLGSDVYGKNILSGINNCEAKVLGLTATPVRDRDKVDVTEYFNARVNGLSVFEAISRGLIPKINYQLCVPEEDIAVYEKELNCKAKISLDSISQNNEIKRLVNRSDYLKWIC